MKEEIDDNMKKELKEFLSHYQTKLKPLLETIGGNNTGEEKLKDELLVAESKLPLGKEFEEFNNIFSRYCTLLGWYLKDSTEKNQKIADELKDIGTDILMAQKQPRKYKDQLNSVEDELTTLMPENGVTKVPEDSGWGELCKEIIKPKKKR